MFIIGNLGLASYMINLKVDYVYVYKKKKLKLC